MDRDNAPGAANQQERLDAYLAGFVDGEGTFHVAVCRSSSAEAALQLVPEFHVSQNPERRQVLDLLERRLGCGRIRENHRGSRDTTLVFVVRRRLDLLQQVIPFLRSESAPELQAGGVRHLRDHRASDGRRRSPQALRVRGIEGACPHHERWRSVPTNASTVGGENPQRPYAEHPRLEAWQRDGPTCMATCRARQK